MKNILIPNKKEVAECIGKDRKFKALVTEICQEAVKEFGHNSELSLEVYSDYAADYKYLVLYVRQDIYEDNIIERMDNILDRFNPQLENFEEYFLMNTDFQPPKNNT